MASKKKPLVIPGPAPPPGSAQAAQEELESQAEIAITPTTAPTPGARKPPWIKMPSSIGPWPKGK